MKLNRFIALILIFTCQLSYAKTFKLLELQELKLDYKQILPGNQEPLIADNGMPDRTLDKELNLGMNIDLLKYFYWDNNIHTQTDLPTDGNGPNGQFRTVGWEFFFGFRLSNYVNVYYYHHSQHLMDAQLPYPYPVKDGLGLTIYLYRAHPDNKGLF